MFSDRAVEAFAVVVMFKDKASVSERNKGGEMKGQSAPKKHNNDNPRLSFSHFSLAALLAHPTPRAHTHTHTLSWKMVAVLKKE